MMRKVMEMNKATIIISLIPYVLDVLYPKYNGYMP